jgi:hypothetical protein
MNEVQVRAFWIWYASAYNGAFGKRCITKAAERSGHGIKLLTAWHEQFGWAKLAAKYDNAVNSKLETKIVKEIVDDINAVRARQKKLVNMLFEKLIAAVEASDLANAKITDIVKLMEFEQQFLYDTNHETRGINLLAIVLQSMPSEKRTEFNEYVERARDAGELRFEPLGSPGRN